MATSVMSCVIVALFLEAVWCGISPAANTKQYQSGDFILGGLVGFRYGGNGACVPRYVSGYGLQIAETIVFAVDEVNHNSDILPNHTLGYDIRDDCFNEEISLYSTYALATEAPKPIGLIGPSSSTKAVLTAKVANLYETPMISYSATSNELSDKERFKYFLRTAPPDKLQAKAMVDILLRFDWRYVGLFYSADSYGIHGALEVQRLAEQADICIAYSAAITNDPSDEIVDDILSTIMSFRKANVIVSFSYSGRIYKILREFIKWYPEVNIVIVSSDGMNGASLHRYGLANTTAGSIFVSLLQNKVVGFKNHIERVEQEKLNDKPVSPWFSEFVDTWMATRSCSNLTQCPLQLDEANQSNAHSAVYAFAHALHNYHQSCRYANNCTNVTGTLLLPYLLDVSFETLTGGKVEFDSEGNTGGRYKLRNLQLTSDWNTDRPEVGVWDSQRNGSRLTFDEDVLRWPASWQYSPPPSVCRDDCATGFISVPLEKKCCWGCIRCLDNAITVDGTRCETCLPTFWPSADRFKCEAIIPTSLDWSHGASIATLTVASLGIVWTLVTSVGLFYYRTHPLIKATSRELSCINVCGLLIAFISVFVFMGRPAAISCITAETLISLSFTMTYAPTMLKVNRIYRIFQASTKSVRRPRFVGPKHQLILSFAFIVVQIILSILSAILGPSVPTLLFPPEARGYIELYCSFGTGFLAAVVYNSAIILLCCFFAFKTRKVPDNYNESKFITVSVYSTLMLFLAVIPVYATAVEVLQKVVTLCVALEINAFLTLVLVYLPKIYGIRFIDDLDVHDWRTTMTNSVGNQPTMTTSGRSKPGTSFTTAKSSDPGDSSGKNI